MPQVSGNKKGAGRRESEENYDRLQSNPSGGAGLITLDVSARLEHHFHTELGFIALVI